MKYCRCDRPRLNDRRPDHCRRCGMRHAPNIQSTDETFAEFFGMLADLPGFSTQSIRQAQEREQAGRFSFGMEYIGRDNCGEGLEEAADGMNYAFFDWLNDRRKGIEDIDPDLLDAVHHFSLAHAALQRKRWKS
jgi:hypothetical protein